VCHSALASSMPAQEHAGHTATESCESLGGRFAGRCLWDHNTDAFAEDSYRNDSLFCVASAYGVYLY